MCLFYEHKFTCKHTTRSFAQYCQQAGLIQTPCKDGPNWQSINMGEACEECRLWFPDRYPSSGGRSAARTKVKRR